MAKKKVKKSSNLSGIRIKLQELANEANKRVSQLTTDNKAVSEAWRTLPKSRQQGDATELFTGNLRTLKQLKQEYARITAFLSDWRSTKEGSDYYQEEKEQFTKYQGAFGGQWLKKYGETYDKSRVSEDLALRAFGLYDRLIEEYQSEDRARMLWNKDSSKISYGSENMIIAIYEMIESGYTDKSVMESLRMRMAINEIELQRQNEFAKSSSDYGLLGDYLSSNMTTKQVLEAIERSGQF